MGRVGHTRWSFLALLTTSALVFSACGSAATPSPATGTQAASAPPSPGQTASAAASASAEAPAKGGVLTFARQFEPVSLDPDGANGDNGTVFTIPQIFDQLVEVGPAGFDPVPGLAESWSASDDQLSYTFTLRDAKYSNGDPVTADDVKYSLDRFRDPNVDLNYAGLGATIKDVVVVDPKTVRVDLSRVDGAFLAEISVFAASIVPAKVLTQMGKSAFAEHPVGSGPFMLDSWTHGQTMKLVRNPNYWKPGLPYLDGVTFQFVADDNARVLGLLGGDFDVVENVSLAEAAQVQNHQGTRLQSETIMALDNIAFNDQKAPLNEKAVRQALAYATPLDQILKSVYLGLGQVANSQLPRNRYWDSTVQPYTFDIAKAKELLATSSVPSGFKLPLVIVAGDTLQSQTAAILQSAWAQIGVDVSVSTVDQGTADTNFSSGDYEAMWRQVTSDVTADDELATLLLDSTGGLHSWFTWYDSSQANQIIKQANSTSDNTLRQQLFSQLQTLALNDMPKLPLVFPTARTGMSSRVHDFKTVPTAWWDLADVWLSN